MAKTFSLDQIGRQIDQLSKRLDTQELSLGGKNQPKTLDEFVALQKQCDQYDARLRHLRSAYTRSVNDRLKLIGNQLMVNLMMTASQDELVELQRVMKKLNGIDDNNDKDEFDDSPLDNNHQPSENDPIQFDQRPNNPPFNN